MASHLNSLVHRGGRGRLSDHTTVSDSWFVFLLMLCSFSPNMVLCIIAKHLHLGRVRSLVQIHFNQPKPCCHIVFRSRRDFLLATLPNKPYSSSLFLFFVCLFFCTLWTSHSPTLGSWDVNLGSVWHCVNSQVRALDLKNGQTSAFIEVHTHADDKLIKWIWLAGAANLLHFGLASVKLGQSVVGRVFLHIQSCLSPFLTTGEDQMIILLCPDIKKTPLELNEDLLFYHYYKPISWHF